MVSGAISLSPFSVGLFDEWAWGWSVFGENGWARDNYTNISHAHQLKKETLKCKNATAY